MNKSILITCLVALLALSGTTAAAEYKVGVVNVDRVLEKSPQAEGARKRIEREFAPRDRELIKQQKEMQKLEDKLVRDGAVMAESERGRLERDIRNLRREIRRARSEFREDLTLRKNEELGKLQQKVLKAIQTLAKKEKFDLILGNGVIYAGKRVDVTDQVIAKLAKDFKRK